MVLYSALGAVYPNHLKSAPKAKRIAVTGKAALIHAVKDTLQPKSSGIRR